MRNLIKMYLGCLATFLFIFFSTLASAQSINGVVIKGVSSKLYLYNLYESSSVADSAIPNQGKFSFKRHFANPSLLRLAIKDKKGDFEFINAEPHVFIEVNGDSIWKSKVLHSKENDCFREIKRAGHEYIQEMNNAADSSNKYSYRHDSVTASKWQQINRKGWISIGKAWYAAIERRTSFCAAMYQLQSGFISYCPIPFSIDTIFHLYNKFPNKLKNTTPGKMAAQYFKVDSLLRKGTKIIDFSAPDPRGKKLSVSNFKGKYLLIDFWASWCGPCREEGKKMLPVYNKYHEKGFEILAVSLDTERQKWINAIREDQFPWYQVSDLQGLYSSVTNLYNVHKIPFSILIDPSGRIISSNLRADVLEKELIEIFYK